MPQPAAKASPELKGFLLQNPDLFIEHYFGHKIQRLEDFHRRLITTATVEILGLVLYPATHGKTTLVSTLLPIWAQAKDPNIRMALIAKNDQDAKKIMQAIHAELLANTELIRDFGPFYAEDKPWSYEQISVEKRTLRAKEPTLAAFGSGSRNALGHRSDWTICDDIITDLNSATPLRRENIKQWFNQGPMTMAEHADDRITVVGTLFDPDDLYHDLVEQRSAETGEPIWFVQREDALVFHCFCGHQERNHFRRDGACRECDCQGFAHDDKRRDTLWPSKWSWLRLMEKKGQIGTLDFNKRFRNIAVDKSRMVFKEEYVRGGWIGKEKYPGCLDANYKVGEYEESWRRASGFDPAVGLTRSAKFCAHVTLAAGTCAEHEKCYWVVDIHRDQKTLPQQADLVLDLHNQYGLLTSKVEANSYQAGLYQAIKEKMDDRGLAFRIEPHYTTRVNKPDPEIGVQRLAPWFENGKVHIPWADAEARRKMGQLVEELIMYPGRTTDTVMALWMAWLALEEGAPRYASFNRLEQAGSIWGRAQKGKFVQNPYYEKVAAE